MVREGQTSAVGGSTILSVGDEETCGCVERRLLQVRSDNREMGGPRHSMVPIDMVRVIGANKPQLVTLGSLSDACVFVYPQVFQTPAASTPSAADVAATAGNAGNLLDKKKRPHNGSVPSPDTSPVKERAIASRSGRKYRKTARLRDDSSDGEGQKSDAVSVAERKLNVRHAAKLVELNCVEVGGLTCCCLRLDTTTGRIEKA